MKIAFKFNYPDFKDGVLALVLTSEDDNEEVVEIFNMDIKRMSLIYTINTWAVYEERMMSLPQNLKSLSVRLSHTNLS